MSPDGHQREPAWLDIAITAVYAAVIGYLSVRHAFWGDEAQQWLIAKASHGLVELYRNRLYEGHPIAWYLLLYPLAHLSDDPEWIKLPQFLISVAAVWLTIHNFLTRGWEKLLFPFGALFIFYYPVVVRPYMLGYLLLVMACMAARKPGRPTLTLVLLGLMASLHVYFAVIAGAFVLFYLWDIGLSPRTLRRFQPRFWLALAFTAAMCALTLYQVWPQPGGKYKGDDYVNSWWTLPAILERGLAPGIELPIPFALIASLVLLMLFAAFRARLRIGLFLALSGGILMAALCLVYGHAAWHAGTLFMCLLAAMFLIRSSATSDTLAYPASTGALAALLALQAAGTVFLLPHILDEPCSNGKYVAALIRQHCPAGCTVLSDQDEAAGPVSAYLGGQPIYYVNRSAFATYVIRDDRRLRPNDLADDISAIEAVRPAIAIFNRDLSAEDAARAHLTLLQRFTGAMNPDELYTVYATGYEPR